MDESCSRLGLRRETLELWQAAFAQRGLRGLCELKYEARHPQTTPRSVAARVKALARKDAQNSCKRIEAILRKQGTMISSRTVWKIMKAAGLATADDRQRAIDAKVQRSWSRGQ